MQNYGSNYIKIHYFPFSIFEILNQQHILNAAINPCDLFIDSRHSYLNTFIYIYIYICVPALSDRHRTKYPTFSCINVVPKIFSFLEKSIASKPRYHSRPPHCMARGVRVHNKLVLYTHKEMCSRPTSKSLHFSEYIYNIIHEIYIKVKNYVFQLLQYTKL